MTRCLCASFAGIPSGHGASGKWIKPGMLANPPLINCFLFPVRAYIQLIDTIDRDERENSTVPYSRVPHVV